MSRIASLVSKCCTAQSGYRRSISGGCCSNRYHKQAEGGAVSLPFEPSSHKRIAVKIVDDRGIESLKGMEVEA